MNAESEIDIPLEILNDPFKVLEFSVPRGRRKAIIEFADIEFLDIRIKNGKGRAEIPSRYLKSMKLLLEANKVTIDEIKNSKIPNEPNKWRNHD